MNAAFPCLQPHGVGVGVRAANSRIHGCVHETGAVPCTRACPVTVVAMMAFSQCRGIVQMHHKHSWKAADVWV